MVTLNKIEHGNRIVCKFVGNSTDTKPTGIFEGVVIENGSLFVEIDTSSKYLYSKEDKTWHKQSGGSGSGGDGTNYDFATKDDIDKLFD